MRVETPRRRPCDRLPGDLAHGEEVIAVDEDAGDSVTGRAFPTSA